MKDLSIDLSDYVYVDFEGYLRAKSGKQLLNLGHVEGEDAAAEAILGHLGSFNNVRVRLAITLY